MKHLYRASDNALTYLIIRDMERGENDTAIADLDLSDADFEKAAADFEAGTLETIELEWRPFEEVKAQMNSIEWLA